MLVRDPSALNFEETASDLLDVQLWVGVDHLDNVSFGVAEGLPDTGEVNVAGFAIPHDGLFVNDVFVDRDIAARVKRSRVLCALDLDELVVGGNEGAVLDNILIKIGRHCERYFLLLRLRLRLR